MPEPTILERAMERLKAADPQGALRATGEGLARRLAPSIRAHLPEPVRTAVGRAMTRYADWVNSAPLEKVGHPAVRRAGDRVSLFLYDQTHPAPSQDERILELDRKLREARDLGEAARATHLGDVDDPDFLTPPDVELDAADSVAKAIRNAKRPSAR